MVIIYSNMLAKDEKMNVEMTYNNFIKQLIDKHKVFPERIFIQNTEVVLNNTSDPL